MSADIRIEYREDGTLDDVFVGHPLCVHIEQMDDGHWWMAIDVSATGGMRQQIHINLTTKRARIYGRAEMQRPFRVKRRK